jgi:hypothetical protein
MKQYLIVALLMVLSTAMAAPSLSFDYEVSPSSINPGGTAQVIVTVSNTASSLTTTSPDAEDMTITLTSRTSGMSIVSGRANLGDIPELSSSSGAFAIKALDSATPGTYILEARGEYDYANENGEFRLSIPVTVGYRSGLTIFAGDSQITPGATESLPITIQNEGKGQIRDLIVTLSSGTSIFPVGNVRDSITVLDKGESGEVNFQIRASDTVSPGIESLILTVTYTDAGGSTQTDTQTLGVTVVDAGTEIVIDSIESNLEPGKTGTVKIGVKNVGETNLEDLYFSLTTGDSLNIRGSNEKLMDSLAMEETGFVEFSFDVSQEAEAVPVESTLDITYQHEGGKKQFTDSKPLGIVLEGKVDLRVIDKSVDKADNEVEIDIANYGNKDADAIRVEVISNGNVFGTGYTDKIKPNKHKVFRFDIPETQDIIVRMSYKDYEAVGEVQIIEDSVTFEKAEISQNGGDPIGSIVIVLVIIVLIIWWLRRRSKNKVKIDVSKYKT